MKSNCVFGVEKLDADPRPYGGHAETQRQPVAEAAVLRAEAERLRTIALTLTDGEVLAGIREMIEELAHRTRLLDNGARHESWIEACKIHADRAKISRLSRWPTSDEARRDFCSLWPRRASLAYSVRMSHAGADFSRLNNEAVLDRVGAPEGKARHLERRREIVQHPFGSIKRCMGQGEFLMKGLEKCAELQPDRARL
jgi:hypothetical protein